MLLTRYDYDAPLNEAGDPTDKYFQIREVIAKHAPVPDGPLPSPSQKGNYGSILLNEQVQPFTLQNNKNKNKKRDHTNDDVIGVTI